MKVRTDYVSNSSSCSFIIDVKYVRKACNCIIDKLYDLDIPYDINNDITVYLYAKNKNVDKMFEALEKFGGYASNYNEKPYHYKNEDPEELSFDAIEYEVQSFFELAKSLADNTQLLSLVEQIEFKSDDYGSGPMNLRDFYDFFDKSKCKPNAEGSEHEFMCEDKLDFRSVLRGHNR